MCLDHSRPPFFHHVAHFCGAYSVHEQPGTTTLYYSTRHCTLRADEGCQQRFYAPLLHNVSLITLHGRIMSVPRPMPGASYAHAECADGANIEHTSRNKDNFEASNRGGTRAGFIFATTTPPRTFVFSKSTKIKYVVRPFPTPRMCKRKGSRYAQPANTVKK